MTEILSVVEEEVFYRLSDLVVEIQGGDTLRKFYVGMKAVGLLLDQPQSPSVAA